MRLNKWELDQAYDVLDAVQMCGIYPSMLSAVDFIMPHFKIDRAEAKQVLYKWIQKKKKEVNSDDAT